MMFGTIRNYISHIWRSYNSNEEKDLFLEEVCHIVEEEKNARVDESKTNEINNSIPNSFCRKTGMVTKCEGNTIFIDDQYTFISDDKNVHVGTKVAYNILISNGTTNILDMNLLDDNIDCWDIQESSSSSSLWSTRVIICKVEKQLSRKLILSPGNVTVDMNNISMDFLPVVGDWVELEVKCLIDEQVINLAGDIIDINQILPIRAHIERGTITAWDIDKQIGTVNRNIFIDKYSLSCGYLPVVGDKIISEIIESDQDNCCWRALKLIPEVISNKDLTNLDIYNSLPEFVEEHSGIQIDTPVLNCDKLNQHKTFDVTVSNISDENIILIKAEFFDSSGQCTVLNKSELNVEILKKNSYIVACECITRNIGSSNSLLICFFENCKIGKRVKINVNVNVPRGSNYIKPLPRLSYDQPSENELIKGRRISALPRFTSKQIPSYMVPRSLNDTLSKYNFKEIMVLTQYLKTLKPCLFSNLTFFNFEDKFHSLLYLEEIANLIMIKNNYDQDNVSFTKYDDFMILKIENLSERRPSIVIGDKIIASSPASRNGVDFEGYVHKVCAQHVFLKFSPLFHETYNEESYSIKVIPSRASYRRLHHAVFLAARNLGKDILFPTKVHEKAIQVNVSNEECLQNENLKSPSNKKLSQLEVLKKLKQIKSNNDSSLCSNIIDEDHKKKLEWHNTKLNEKQKDAVRNVLLGRARPMPYIIFGPPGTGKTVTIIEMILQIIRFIPQSRLLITAPSNSASDLIALRLIDSGVLKPGDLVRLVSYNYAVSDSIPVNLIPYCATGSIARDGTNDNEILHSGIKFECGRAALGRHLITVCTCSMAGQLHLIGFPKGHFSHIIVDEAGQGSEPEVLVPLTFLDKISGQIILAGDPMQLGPVVLCNIAGDCGLNESYLDRLVNRFPYVIDPQGFPNTSGYDPRLVTKLLHNYRSLPSILKLTSSLFYNDELIATIDDKTSKEAIFLEKLDEILPKTNLKTTPCMVFHGVNGENHQNFDSPSWYNPHEAAQVFYYVNELYRMGVSSSQLGIITPYIKQVKEIRSLLKQAEFDIPKVGTVEEFQGQEFEVIILSTVRSQQKYISMDVEHSLGFLTSPRRLNVAISRSKVLLIIVGNPNLLSLDMHWRSVIKYCLENGSYTGCEIVL